MKSYKQNKMSKGTLRVNQSVEGEPIETKIERIIANKEPIKDGAPIIYTERKEGVKKAYDIRTDRFEVAIEGMDKVAKSYKAKREERYKDRNPVKREEDGKTESTQGKPETGTGKS